MKKICTKCKQEKDKDEFNKNNKAFDGKLSWCRACQKKKNEAYKKSDWLKMVIG